MKVLVIILLVGLVVFMGYEIFAFVKDIKARKAKKDKQEKDNHVSTDNEVDRKE